jgi:hypothetical protein
VSLREDQVFLELIANLKKESAQDGIIYKEIFLEFLFILSRKFLKEVQILI